MQVVKFKKAPVNQARRHKIKTWMFEKKNDGDFK
jgi:hypothetical protein